MGLVFGMDEAGYGPNLGPLVITVTAWEVPGSPFDIDLWNALSAAVARTEEKPKPPDRIYIGDSKEVYNPSRGLGHLEESVLTLLTSQNASANGFHELLDALAPGCRHHAAGEPWYADNLDLPYMCPLGNEPEMRWQTTCSQAGVILRGIACDVVFTDRYNRLVQQYDSKGLALSRMSLALLKTLWDPDDSEPALIIADKHGGRNRYDELLAEVLEDQFIFRLEEGTARSRYRVGQTDLCFQTKAESHFPVAAASMISKYVRELAMICFNRFWQTHLPDIKPTKGYPTDARRFREDIADVQQQLGIPDQVLWRDR